LFLGTPHRGADLAKMLQCLLNVTFSDRKFVKDLSPDSQTIKEINDTFDEHSSGLELASFWESTATPVIGVCPNALHADNQVVVPEYSATLGFRGEIRVPLNGDHLGIVKYSSRDDNNYRVVSKTLVGMVSLARRKGQQQVDR
jgi:hypothetical protein